MFDLKFEKLIAFREACKIIPGRPHISTLHRWRTRGAKGVRLSTCLVGGKRFTTIEAVRSFIAALNAADGQDLLLPESPSVEAELEAEGL